jgi:hypothetical protein
LTATASVFTHANVPSGGIPMLIVGAGSGGSYYTGTATYSSPTQVTLSGSPSGVTSAQFVFGPDDSQAIANAITSMATSGGAVLFPPGVYVVGTAAAVTAPPNVQVTFEEGAILAPFAQTVTVNGRVTAHPTQQIFGGAGLNGPVTAAGTTLRPSPREAARSARFRS